MKTVLAALIMACTFSVSAQEKKIKPTDLPMDALEFIATYYSKEAVTVAKQNTKDGNTSYEAVLTDKTEIEFTSEGSWREVDGKGKAIAAGFIPKPFMEYVQKNYPKQNITKIDKRADEIEVDVENGKELIFSIHGKFVRVNK